MKLKISLFLFVICSLVMTQSCSDDTQAEPEPEPHFENSNLEVKVRVETDAGLMNAIGAQIFLYDSKENRAEDYEVVHKGITNAEGKHLFSGLASPEYWILVTFNGESKLFNKDSPYSTPGHPIVLNKLDVVFEK